jgi:hypothetical protein
LACGRIERGVDQLLDGAAAAEPACLALGGQDVGAAADAELRGSRAGQPDAVSEADLEVGGQVDQDRLADAAGCCAEAACGNGPDGLAALPAEGGKSVLDGGCG